MQKRKNMESPDSQRDASTQISTRHNLNGSYDDTVRERAYQLYEARMQSNHTGDPVSDWLEAEQLVRKQLADQNDVLT